MSTAPSNSSFARTMNPFWYRFWPFSNLILDSTMARPTGSTTISVGRTEATGASEGTGRGNEGNSDGGTGDGGATATGAATWVFEADFRAAEWQELAITAATQIRMRPRFKFAPKRKATKTVLLRSCSSGERILGQISAWPDWSQPL